MTIASRHGAPANACCALRRACFAFVMQRAHRDLANRWNHSGTRIDYHSKMQRQRLIRVLSMRSDDFAAEEPHSNAPNMHTTAVLFGRVRAGDASARSALVARVEPLLRRFAHGRLPSMLRHAHDTADLLQHTWLKVLERMDQIEIERPGDFFAYLRTALVNGLRESLRYEQRHPKAAWDDLDAELALVPAEHVDRTEWLAYEQALQRLAPEHRALIAMRFEFGMSFVEIAQELGETATAVRLRTSRALARMVGFNDGADE